MASDLFYHDHFSESDSYFVYHPYPVIECITNCGKHLASSPLHLKANCKTCDRIAVHFDILYIWDISYPVNSNNVYSSEKHDWKEHSYTITDEFLPDIRLKTTAFRSDGVYKIHVTMAVRNRSSKLSYPVASAFYYATIPKKETSSSICYINPSSGKAATTVFEITCNSIQENVVYEMYYSDCHACDDEESFKLFHRGYSGIVKGQFYEK